MFGIGLGEIILILIIIFLICPKDLPKMLKKAALFISNLEKMKNKIFDIKNDFENSIKDELKEIPKIPKIENKVRKKKKV